MMLKKLFFSSLILLGGTIIYSSPMIDEIQHLQADLNNTKKINNAAYFKLHYHDGCYTYMISTEIFCDSEDLSEFIFSKTKDCQELCKWHKNATSKSQRMVTYYDIDWSIIATMDASYLPITNSELIHYVKRRIDPNTKAKATMAKIKTCKCMFLESHAKIEFYDSEEKIILEAQCPQNLKSQKKYADLLDAVYCAHHQSSSGKFYDLERFEYCLDLRDLSIIQDCRSSYRIKNPSKNNGDVKWF